MTAKKKKILLTASSSARNMEGNTNQSASSQYRGRVWSKLFPKPPLLSVETKLYILQRSFPA